MSAVRCGEERGKIKGLPKNPCGARAFRAVSYPQCPEFESPRRHQRFCYNMNKFNRDLVKSMGEACEHAEGKRTDPRIKKLSAKQRVETARVAARTRCGKRRKLGKER